MEIEEQMCAEIESLIVNLKLNVSTFETGGGRQREIATCRDAIGKLTEMRDFLRLELLAQDVLK